jgi:hypothetical protein
VIGDVEGEAIVSPSTLLAPYFNKRYTFLSSLPLPVGSWGYKTFLTLRGHTPQGPVGVVDVDAYTGEVLASEATATEMIANAASLASSLLSANS